MTQQIPEGIPSPAPVMSQEILDGITFDAPTSETPEPKTPIDPVPAPAPETPVTPTPAPVVETPAPTEQKVTPPARYDGESDIQHNLRTQLFFAGQAKANAGTEEEKTILGQEMKRIRENLAQTKQESTVPVQPTPQAALPDDDKKAALEALKQLGVPTTAELSALIDERAQAIVKAKMEETNVLSRHAEQSSAVTDFYKLRPDISSDPSKQEMLENHFMSMFKDQLPTMSKQQLAVALDMSANYLFPKGSVSKQTETTQNKIDALNISGSQAADTSKVDTEMRAKLKADGWSDADINSFSA